MNNPVVRFSLQTIVLLSIAFSVHVLVLKQQDLVLYDNKIVLSYIINTVLAIGIFTLLYVLRMKYKSQLGFLFMAGSGLKYVVFFIVFYPIYKLDSEISRGEFFAFFTPYFLCLILETLSLSKLLNKLD